MRISQGMDGTAHLTYYDKVHSLSFVWDGTLGDKEFFKKLDTAKRIVIAARSRK